MSHVKHHNTDVAFLQETHVRASDNVRLFSRWRGQCFHSLFQARARGVSILVRQNIPFEAHNVIADKYGRYVIVSGKLYNSLVALVNVYAPNTDDENFFKQLFSSLPDLNVYSLFLGGDFNCWLDPALDSSSTKSNVLSKSASVIHAFLSEYGMCDVWRTLNPHERDYSYFSHMHHTYSRIDYFIIDTNCLQQVHSCAYHSIVISDHAPLTLSLSLPHPPVKAAQWRFNSTLLSDENFVKFIQDEIRFYFATNFSPETSSLVVWNAFKAYIRGQIIAYSARIKKQSTHERNKLMQQIKETDEQYALKQS